MKRELEIELHKVASGLGWTIVKARRRFVRAGIARHILGSRDYFVSRTWLSSNLRSVLERIDELEDAGLLRSTRGCKRRDASGRYAPKSASEG